MSYSEVVETRYIELKEVKISDYRRASKFRVIIKHQSGAQEVFETAEKSSDAVVDCDTFVNAASTQATLQVIRRDRPQRSNRTSEATLIVSDKSKGWYEVEMPSDYGMRVEVKFGSIVPATNVADLRLGKAMRAMKSKEKMMDILEISSDWLCLFAQLGEAAGEINAAAGAVACIVQFALERVTDIPASFRKLSKITLELVDDMESARAAKKSFNSKHAQKALDRLIELIIRATEELIYCYSRPKSILVVKEWLSPRRDAVAELERDLLQHKQAITQAFLVEVQSGIVKIQDDVGDVKNGVSAMQVGVAAMHNDVKAARKHDEEKENKLLLDTLLPPNGSLFHGKVACLEGTRKSVLDTINLWVLQRQTLSRLFWLHGVAGCGKSTVASSVCQNLRARLAGSFFCKRDQDERRNCIRLFWSLAFYLAQANAEFKEALLQALREPDIFVNMDLDTQVDRILLQPLTKTKSSFTPVIFVVDALDELNSNDKASQYLAKIVQSAPWVLFVVTSRDLPGIRNGLSGLAEMTEEHDLFQDDARDDISAYLRSQFLPNEPLAELQPYIEDAQIRTLVDKSQGLFIWIRTVVEFIIRTDVGKLEVLDSVLVAEKAAESESALDDIYRTVLENASGSSSTARDVIRLIIGLILVTSVNEPLPAEALHAFLPPSVHVLQTEFDTILKKMSPVLIVSISGVRVYHTSFLDFSSSKDRCGQAFWTEERALNTIMATGCFEIMQSGTRNLRRQYKKVSRSGLRFNICNIETSYLPNSEINGLEERASTCISPELIYSSVYWLDHIIRSDLGHNDTTSCIEGSVAEKLPGMAQNLLCTSQALYWLEVMSIKRRLSAARSILIRIQSEPQILNNGSVMIDAASELRWIVDQFHQSISLSTPQLYISTLPWLSTSSCLWKAWQSEFAHGQVLTKSIQQRSLMLHHIVCPAKVFNVSVSSDGNYFASGGEDSIIRIWDMQTGAPAGEPLVGHVGVIMSLAFSPVANLIASSSTHEPFIRIWDIDGRTAAREPLMGHAYFASGLAFSRDGTRLVSGSYDGTVRVWDMKSGTTIARPMAGHTAMITFVAFSPDGLRVASASEDKTVCLWDVEKCERVGEALKGHAGYVFTLAFSPDGSTLASGSEDQTIRLWDVRTGASVGEPLRGHRWYVRSLVYTNDGAYILSGSGDSTIRVWDAKSGQSLGATLKGTKLGFACSFALSSDGTRGVVASGARDLTVWDIPAALSKAALRGHSHHVFSVAISPDGSRIASGGWDNSIYLWSRSGKLLNSTSMGHDTIVFFVQFSPDGSRLASGAQDGTMRIWDVENGTLMREFRHSTWVSAGVWTPDGKRLAVGSEDSLLRIWDPESGLPIGEPLTGHSAGVKMVVCSPDGSRLASVGDKTVRVWDADTGAPIGEPFSGHTEPPEALAFSPDGSRLASGGWDKTVRVWDVQTGKALLEPLMHERMVQSVAFSPDGRFILSASWDAYIRAWDTYTGKLVGIPLKGHTDAINCVAITRDGKHIVSGGRDNAIRIWDAGSFFWEDEQSVYNCELLGPERVPKSVPEDGWIRTSEGELLLWIPSQFRGPVCDMSLLCISTDQENHPIRIRWDAICRGKSWEKVRLE
ncbi:WD40 repeat-like protein [Laetiporus sulphureus 93-53]|uniref:WD40 repeat-like protein n=1 Tax=Laetiporus sulphureus 93-53 TaxID=1314785 RepID=A0A165CXK9_9APHY|nr:WD40 repeat-like protein [Laetiporus sulphureus 93-53]KZT03681.1 WD40 repeat-like protein [Laetiporus sulphureus 93-53]